MKTSTLTDIYDNYDRLVQSAEQVVYKRQDTEDWWHTVVIGDLWFDMNVYDWQTEDGEPTRIVTVYPVVFNDIEWCTNTSTFLRLLEKKKVEA